MSPRTSLAASLLLVVSAAAQTITIPNGYAAAEGGSSNAFPWNRFSTTANLQQQMIYDSSHFTAQGITSPIIINRLRWRANAVATTTTWAGGTHSGCWVDMSTAAVDFAAPSTTMASNHGTNLVRVYSGNVQYLAGAGNGTGIPGNTVVDLAITPFVYDPTQGDLIIDCWVPSNSIAATPGQAVDVHATAGVNASRVFNSTNAAAGTITANHGTIVTLDYVPAVGLFAAFTANVTTGNSPLAVQFTDQSFSSDPGGITSWAWDVDGDNVTDYTSQNPTHSYGACGIYTVSLTVTDASNPADTETKTGYIVVDPISADFTAAPVAGFAPLFTTFTDTSTGPVTTWAWDLDGDTIIDSNAQNPVFAYATPGTYSVSLTVSNGCFSDTETKTNMIVVVAAGTPPAPPEILQYQFNEVRGTSVANTATTNVLPSHGTVSNTGWHGNQTMPLFHGNEAGFGMLANAGNVPSVNTVNTTGGLTLSGDMTMSWWQRLGATAPGATIGYGFGGTGSSVRWFTGGVAGTSLWYRSSGAPDINATYNVQANPGVWEHVCLVVDNTAGTGKWYFNGVLNTTTNFTPGLHSFTTTELHVGWQTATTSGYVRYYDLDDFRIYSRPLSAGEVIATYLLGEHASAGTFGSSCAGPGGTPVIAGNGVPAVGNLTFAVDLSNAEDLRGAIMVLGLTPSAFGTFDLSAVLGAGCQLEVDPFGSNFHVTMGNAASQPLGIPLNTMFQGLHVYGQWLVLGTTGAATRVIDINIE
ncbi:MAG: PKD domain-containing protein [Planctomycetes bacterium]|nr:PKD domain-containing protein [Planctomycetota bacterium]